MAARTRFIGKIIALVTISVFGIAYLLGSWFFSSVLVVPDPVSITEAQERLAQMDVSVYSLPAPETVSIQSGAVQLSGWYFENPNNADCAVMLLHGFNGARYSVLPYAPQFWRRGCHLLMYDARAHGFSSGSYRTYGYYEKQDARVALDWLMLRSDLDESQIGLLGVSFGAATSLQTIPLAPRLAFVISDSAYEDLRTIIRNLVNMQVEGRMQQWMSLLIPGGSLIAQSRADFSIRQVSPLNTIGNAPMPVLLIHATEDEVVPVTHAQNIYAQSNPARTDLYITDWGALHAMSIEADPQGYANVVDGFLAQQGIEFGSR